VADEDPVGFSDVGINDAVFEILDVDYGRLVRFLPTDQEDAWPDGRDRNVHGLRVALHGTSDGRERHHRLGCEVEMEDPTAEMRFVHVADSGKESRAKGHLLFVISLYNVTVDRLCQGLRTRNCLGILSNGETRQNPTKIAPKSPLIPPSPTQSSRCRLAPEALTSSLAIAYTLTMEVRMIIIIRVT
jgi:hypothetical protein